MIAKLAVLVVEKADGSVETVAGEKGDIASMARDMIRAANDDPKNDVFRITALGLMGVLKEKRWKANAPAVAVPAAPVEDAPEHEELDATDLRALLKSKGVSVPPRITLESMRKMASDLGVEV